MPASTPVSGNQYQIAAGKQSAVGTPQGTYTWFPRWGDGTDSDPELSTNDIREGDGSPDIAYILKKTQSYKGKIVHRAPRTADVMYGIAATCGTGSDAVTGSSNYTHAITPKTYRDSWTIADLYKPANGGTNFGIQIVDAQFMTMKITAAFGEPIVIEYDYVGLTGSSISTLGTVTYDTSSAPLIFWGGTFSIDGSSVGTVAPFIRKFELTMSQPADETIQSERTTLDAVLPTLRTLDIKYEIMLQDLTQFKKAYYNAGTTDSSLIGTGAASLVFFPGGDATQTNNNLTIAVGTIDYKAAKRPAPKLDGKALFQTVEGIGVPTSGVLATYTAKNQTAGAAA